MDNYISLVIVRPIWNSRLFMIWNPISYYLSTTVREFLISLHEHLAKQERSISRILLAPYTAEQNLPGYLVVIRAFRSLVLHAM